MISNTPHEASNDVKNPAIATITPVTGLPLTEYPRKYPIPLSVLHRIEPGSIFTIGTR